MNKVRSNVFSMVLNRMNFNRIINFQIEKLTEILNLDFLQQSVIRLLLEEHLEEIKIRQINRKSNQIPANKDIRKNSILKEAISSQLDEKQKNVYTNFQKTKQFKEFFYA